MPQRPKSIPPSDHEIWTHGFRHGYAGVETRQGSGNPAYDVGYAAGHALRQAHHQEFELALFERRRLRAIVGRHD